MANEFVARKGIIVLSGGIIASGGLSVDTAVSASFFKGDGSQITNVNFTNLTNVPVGLVSSSTQINTGSFQGSFDGTASYADTAGYGLSALTASYALTAGTTGGGVTGEGSTGKLAVWTNSSELSSSIVDDNGSRILVGGSVTASMFSGDLVGTASHALTASYAENAISDWAEITNTPAGLVSSSTQVSFTTIGDKPVGLVSSSTQAVTWTVATASYVSWPNIDNKPVGLVSSSTQASGWTVATSSYALSVPFGNLTAVPSGIVSSSAQTLGHINGATITPALVTASAILVTGAVTAQEFHTQFVSASIIYQSGSTKFGDTSDDVMSVTGTLHVSGSTQFDGPVTFGSGLGPTTIAGSLYSTGSQTVNIGTTVIATVSTGSYDMAHFKYVTKRGANYRTGEVMAVWSASVAVHTDNSTTDIGNTSDVAFDVDILSGNARLKAVVVNTNGWVIKSIVQAI